MKLALGIGLRCLVFMTRLLVLVTYSLTLLWPLRCCTIMLMALTVAALLNMLLSTVSTISILGCLRIRCIAMFLGGLTLIVSSCVRLTTTDLALLGSNLALRSVLRRFGAPLRFWAPYLTCRTLGLVWYR